MYVQILPVIANDIPAHIKQLFQALENRIKDFSEHRFASGYHSTIGYGAGTKDISGNHGEGMLKANPKLDQRIATTHGDIGTTAFILSALRKLAANPPAGVRLPRISIYGANGVIGEAISRSIVSDPSLRWQSIQLVGRADPSNLTRKRDRLIRLQASLENIAMDHKVPIHISQQSERAAVDHDSDILIVATQNMQLTPANMNSNTLVFDVTTPPACHPKEDWTDSNIKVLHAGYVEFDKRVVPEELGWIGEQPLYDLGMGVRRAWGCLADSALHSIFDYKGHIVGRDISYEQVQDFIEKAERVGMYPQPPESTVVARESYCWERLKEEVFGQPHKKP